MVLCATALLFLQQGGLGAEGCVDLPSPTAAPEAHESLLHCKKKLFLLAELVLCLISDSHSLKRPYNLLRGDEQYLGVGERGQLWEDRL